MTLETFVTFFLTRLTDSSIPYCILRNYQGLPRTNVGNDIDLLIRPCDKRSVLDVLFNIKGITITDHIMVYVDSVFIYGVIWGEDKHAIEIDLISTLCWKGLPYLDVDNILRNSLPARDLPSIVRIPTPADEALSSFFASYLVGGWIQQKYQHFVRKTFSGHSEKIREALIPICGNANATLIIDAVRNDDEGLLYTILPRLRRGIVLRSILRAPFCSIRSIYLHYIRVFTARFTPIYIRSICILGPDGAGKTEVISRLRWKLQNTTKGIQLLNFRPIIFLKKSLQGPVIDPHGRPARSVVISTLKIMVWFMELWMDQIAHGRKNLTLRIWDRYYHDVLVDPKRYRYGGPMWLARVVGQLIPKPDLWILLDAPPEVLQARKQEVPFEETARQRNAYLKLIEGMKNGIVVDAAQPLEKVVADVNVAILEYMATKTKKRFE